MNERLLTVFDAASGPFERGVSRVERSLGRFERGVTARMKKFDQRWEQSARSVRMLERALVAIGTGAGANAVRKYAENWRQLGRFMTAAGFEAEDARDKIIDAAMRVRGDAGQLALAVKQLGLATPGDGLDLTIRRAETLQKLLKLNGATAAQASSTMLQLTQAIRSGTLQGDEFRSLRENAPAQFMEAIAREAGATIAELRQLSKDGKLSADLVIRALDSLDGLADKKFAKLALSGEEAFKSLETGLSKFVGKVDESLGTTETINRAIADMGKWLEEASDEAEQFAEVLTHVAIAVASLTAGRLGAAGIAGVTAAVGKLGIAHKSLLVWYERQNAAAQRNLALAHAKVAANSASTAAANTLVAAEARATAASEALAAAQTRVAAGATLATVSMGALNRVLAFFGGWPGLIFTALAAGAIYYTSQVREATRETEALVNVGDDLNATLADAAQKQRELERATNDAGEAQTEASKLAIEVLRAELAILRDKNEEKLKELKLDEARRQERIAELRELRTYLAGARKRGAGGPGMEDRIDEIPAEVLKLERASALAAARIRQAEALLHSEKATELPEITVTAPGGGSGGKGKKDKPPELQGPEYDPGALFRDQLIEARDLIEENRTAEEKLARAKARILALQPALVEAIRAEAFAHGEVISNAEAEVKAKAVIEQANARLVESAETVEQAQREAFQEFARGLASTIRQADSLSDALDKIADQLLDMVLDDAFSTLFGGKSSSPLGSVFGFISKGIGSLFGGGAGGFTGVGAVPYASGGMVRGPGTGRSDSIPARLSNGEFVVNARATARNRGLLEAINGGRPARAFADGGLVTPPAAPVMAPPPRIEARAAVAATFAPSITVNVEGGDDPQASGAAAARAVQSIVQAEMAKSMRPGGMLDSALKGKR